MRTYPALIFLACTTLQAATFTFSTGDVSDVMAMASRPATASKFEIEAADDFVTTTPVTNILGGTFTGLLTGGATAASISFINVEIYRVFPLDSDVGRTSGTPTFSTALVPTRVNSPSDVALVSADSSVGEAVFMATVLGANFTALNSIGPGGIHPKPGNATGGNGPVTGLEVLISFTLSTPFSLEAGHYFFVPQVAMDSQASEFYWLSGQRPIVAPGTPFSPDLQAWTRDAGLDPDWLRVGTDIVGSGTFNGAFTLAGNDLVPEPDTSALLFGGLAVVALRRRGRS